MLIKVCGITNSDDARYAIDAGVDWIGLNLVAGPRRIDPAIVEMILSKLDDPSCGVVLVRLDGGMVPNHVLTMLREHGVGRLQLYGDPIPDTVHRLAEEGFESIVVQPVGEEASFASLDALLTTCGENQPDYVLLDAPAGERLGGTGCRGDWDAIARARAAGRYENWPPVLLAGGLTPDNVAEAIVKLSPAGVDVSSGVESTPGRKCRDKIDAFVAAVRACRPDRP